MHPRATGAFRTTSRQYRTGEGDCLLAALFPIAGERVLAAPTMDPPVSGLSDSKGPVPATGLGCETGRVQLPGITPEGRTANGTVGPGLPDPARARPVEASAMDDLPGASWTARCAPSGWSVQCRRAACIPLCRHTRGLGADAPRPVCSVGQPAFLDVVVDPRSESNRREVPSDGGVPE